MGTEQIWEEYGLEELESGFANLFPESSLSFRELWENMLSGNVVEGMKIMGKEMLGLVLGQSLGLKELFISLLIIGIFGVLISRFVEIFDQNQVADLCFYVIYLCMGALLLNCYQKSAAIAVGSLENIVLFVKLLLPTFLLTLGIAGKTLTVSAYSVLLLLIIFLVEHLFLVLLMGGIHIYVLLSLFNGVWREDKLELVMELLEKAVSYVLKGVIGFVSSVSILQSIITPMIDGMKMGTISKVVSLIPGIGAGTESVTKLVLGSTLVVKNSIGVLLVLLLVFLCISPLAQILGIAITLKTSAAILSFVGDKRLTNCTNKMGDGSMMLFKILATSMLLFMISLTLVSASTNVSI